MLYTDVWVSMGEEATRAEKVRAFAGYVIDEALVAVAAPDAIVLHCLPAHRGEEITAEVLDGPQSRVWLQAENRMHSIRGLLLHLLGGGAHDEPVPKNRRQHQIAKLLAEHAVTSQPQLVELLAVEGIDATQATVSRDLEELGAVRVRLPGVDRPVYAIAELPKDQIAPLDHLRRVLGEWVVDLAVSGALVIIRTPPGSAHVVASALDRTPLEGMLGTVAGDDTILAIADETLGGRGLANRIEELAAR